MNTQGPRLIGCRKAWIAFVAAISCLMIYILACIVSPPAWSPDSSKVAVLVTPPGEHPDKFAIFVYDIETGEHILLDEAKKGGILSAPAWSPDGKWIAYYKVDSPPSEEKPAPSKPDTNAAIRPPDMIEPKPKLPISEKPFSEENRMLPSMVFALAEDLIKEEEFDTIDVKLMLVSPDAKERKILLKMKWISNDEEEGLLTLVYFRPAWSSDSKRLFYVRGLEDLSYAASIEITTGKTYAHTLNSIGTPVVSPDGKWIASYLEDDEALVASSVDGTMSKYMKVELDIEAESLLMMDGMFFSSDSKKIFIVADESVLHSVDVDSGRVEKYTDPDANQIAYYTLSSDGKKLYYIAGFDDDEDDLKFTLRYMNLKNKKTGEVFSFSGLPEFSDEQDGGRFSIAPNGKIVLLRAVIEDEFGEEKSALVFFDGKTKKIVKTDRWLLKPLYSEDDLIFEPKLLGKWRDDDDVKISITKGKQDKTYKMVWVEDGEEHNVAANMFRLRGMMFLGIFSDESILEKKDSSDSHLVPDLLMRIVQVEPKFLIQSIMYDEFVEMLEDDIESLKAMGAEHEDIIELERDD